MAKEVQKGFGYSKDFQKWVLLTEQSIEADSNENDELLLAVLKEFQTFATQYEKYFSESSKMAQIVKLRPGKVRVEQLKFRQQRALEKYFRVLGRVAEQRQVDHYRDILNEGTDIAKTYLVELGLPIRGVLLYFDKVAVIKHLPYTNVPIIGVPYSLVSAKTRDWFSIPHEIGHYVYWNLGREANGGGSVQFGNLAPTRNFHEYVRQEVEKKIVDLDKEKIFLKDIILGWLEEIIADIVGTHLAGKSFVESFATIISNRAGNIEDLNLNDGTHPPLCLRPFIRNKVLDVKELDQVDLAPFFKESFGIEHLDEHQLSFYQNVFENVDKGDELSLGEFLTRLAGPDKGELDLNQKRPLSEFMQTFIGESFQHNQKVLTISEINEVLLPVVGHIYDLILREISIQNSEKSSEEVGFTQLLEAAQQEAEKGRDKEKTVEEILLQPSVVENGELHSHYLYGWHGIVWKLHWYSSHDASI